MSTSVQSGFLNSISIAFMFCRVLPGCSERVHYQALPGSAVVLAFGDSVTAGVGAGPGQDYSSQLAVLTGLQ